MTCVRVRVRSRTMDVMEGADARAPEAAARQPLHRQLAPSALVPEEATLNYVNNDIEDIYRRMDNAVSAEKIDACAPRAGGRASRLARCGCTPAACAARPRAVRLYHLFLTRPVTRWRRRLPPSLRPPSRDSARGARPQLRGLAQGGARARAHDRR